MKNQLNRLRAIAIVIMSLTILALVFSACARPDVTIAEITPLDTEAVLTGADTQSAATVTINMSYMDERWNKYGFTTREEYYSALKEELDTLDFSEVKFNYGFSEAFNGELTIDDWVALLKFISSYIEIRSLDTRGFAFYESNKLYQMLAEFPNLNKLDLETFDDLDKEAFPDMPAVETLICDSSDLLSHFPNVRDLTITTWDLDSFSGVLPTLKNLVTVRVTTSEMAAVSDFTAALASMNQLQYFNGKPIEEMYGYADSKEYGANKAREASAQSLFEEAASDVYSESFEKPMVGKKLFIGKEAKSGNSVNIFIDNSGILPLGVFAQTADECDTLILVTLAKSSHYDNYSNGFKAMSDEYDITVFNLKEKLRYQGEHLVTINPPVLISSNNIAFWEEEVHGVLSADTIYSYVAGLLEGESQ